MVLVRKRNYKKIIIYSVVLLVIIILGGYLLLGSFTPSDNSNVTLNANAGRELPIIDDYSEDFFSHESYQSLEESGEGKIPLDFENINKGKINPFNLPTSF